MVIEAPGWGLIQGEAVRGIGVVRIGLVQVGLLGSLLEWGGEVEVEWSGAVES